MVSLTIDNDIVGILSSSANGESTVTEKTDAKQILEDTQSPITTKLVEKIYHQVIDKSHIDFDDIPVSAGDIKLYKGYGSMIETLNTIKQLESVNPNNEVRNYVETVFTSIKYIESLAFIYKEGFRRKNEQIMLEYNLFVFCTVEATTAILSQFVEIVKGFKDDTYEFRIKNTRYKADCFYFEQLQKFNNVNAKGEYQTYLNSILNGEKNNFIGTEVVVGALTIAAGTVLIVVPMLRLLIYQFYMMRTKISDALALQVTFLEMNRSRIEANSEMDAIKKKKVIQKQERIKSIFEKLSEKIRVDNFVARKKSKDALKQKDSTINADSIRKEVDSSPLNLL